MNKKLGNQLFEMFNPHSLKSMLCPLPKETVEIKDTNKMDPTDCLNRWDDAVCAGKRSEAREAAEDLCTWLQNGGFEPRWFDGQRTGFRNWCFEQGLLYKWNVIPSRYR